MNLILSFYKKLWNKAKSKRMMFKKEGGGIVKKMAQGHHKKNCAEIYPDLSVGVMILSKGAGEQYSTLSPPHHQTLAATPPDIRFLFRENRVKRF